MDRSCFWRGLESLSVSNEWLNPKRVLKFCVIDSEIVVLSEDKNIYYANLENSSEILCFQKLPDVSAIDIASNNRQLFYVDSKGQVYRCDSKSLENRQEIIIREDAKNCSHGHRTPSHRVRIKSLAAGEFGVLYVSTGGQLWASGCMPQLAIDSAEPKKVTFFEGRSVYRATVGKNFAIVVVRKSICENETDTDNDEDVFISTCPECQIATGMSSPTSQLSLVETCPLGVPVSKSSDDTSSTSAPHTHDQREEAHTLTEDTSPSTEDSELTKIHFDENKKADVTSTKKLNSNMNSSADDPEYSEPPEINDEEKRNMIFINTEAAKQFLTKQLSWVSASEDYLVECTEKPTRIIKENVSNLTNLVVEGVKTVGDKVATLSRHMSGSSETNEATEAYENLVSDELNPLMYSNYSNYKLDDIQKSSSTISDKEINGLNESVKVLVKSGQNLLNSEVWVWGDVNNGQLGTGDLIKRTQPTLVTRLANLGVHKIACGKSHCAALTLDGRVFVWGRNIWHQINTESKEDRSSPQQFVANTNTDRARDLACGDNHTLVFTLDGNIYFLGKHSSGFTEVIENLKSKVKYTETKDNPKEVKNVTNLKHHKKHQDFYFKLSGDLEFNRRIVSSGIMSSFYPYPRRSQETPALQDLAIEQQFLEEMLLVYQSLVKPLLKKTTLLTSDSSVYEELCSAYADIIYFTALNVMTFWRYTESSIKAIELAMIHNCDEHIVVYRKYLHAMANIIVLNGFQQIALHVDVSNNLQNLFSDRLPSSKQRNNKKISESVIACALMHPLSRLKTYKCITQSLMRYNSSLSPEVKAYFDLRLFDVLTKWDIFNDEQEKYKKEADFTKLFWESAGKTLECFRNPERRLIRESRCNPLSLLHSGRFSTHWFVLLTDILVHINGSTQNVHSLTTLWVEAIADTDALQNAIHLITPEESMTVIAPTSLDKAEWVQALQTAIKASLNKHNSAQTPAARTAVYTYINKNQLYKDAKYEGRWLNGKLHGSGKLNWADGKSYLGQFHNNQIQGHGRMEIPSVGVYEGQWRDNLQNGFGVMKYCSGDIYEGHFKDGLAHGHGVRKQGDFTTSTATIYMGEWVQGVRQGYGVMDDIGKGEKYLGCWNDNKKHGCGLIVTLDGIYYEGVFTNDILTGHGVMVFEDGTHYEGEFRSAGVFSGKGTLTFSSGDRIEGTLSGAWTEGVKISAGTLHMNVSNPALPPNSKPNSFGKLCISPNQKWNGLFRQCLQLLGVPDNLFAPMSDHTLSTRSNTVFTNKKIWHNIAVLLSNSQNDNLHKKLTISDTPKKVDNKLSSEQLDVIPDFGQDELTIESYNDIKKYLSKACELPGHPIGQLVAGCAAAFSASYGGVRVHPLLLSHAVAELGCVADRLYSVVRLLFPALPLLGEHIQLYTDAKEDENDFEDGELASVSGVVQPLLLPRVHASLHVLYALHHQREDEAYSKRLLKWNRQTDITLMSFLGVDQKFWVGHATRSSTGTPPFSPVKDEIFSAAVDTLQQLKTTFSPMEKLLVIKSTFRQVTLAVEKELGAPYLWTMDELFPVFHFVVVRARILQLGSEIHFIEDFLESSMQNGELGLMFTTLKGCYQQILLEKIAMGD